jgi:hypothetical protein
MINFIHNLASGVMKFLMRNKILRKWQAVAAVLLFVFLAGGSFAGVAEDLSAGKSLQDVVQTSLDSGIKLKDLIADLDEAGVSGSDIICALFQAGQDHATVITAALDGGLSSADVAVWAVTCGATQSEIQLGYSMAGESLPGNFLFSNHATTQEDSAKEYLYNSPSQSK